MASCGQIKFCFSVMNTVAEDEIVALAKHTLN